jgi:hypothetical protein
MTLARDDLPPALDRYVNESFDTIKANFGRALKHRGGARFDNRRIILAAMASGPLAGMSFADVLAKVRIIEAHYPESNLRRYLKELSSEDEKGRLLRIGRDGKYRFVEPVYHTVALATLVGPRTPKHARPNRYVEDIIATAWLNTAVLDTIWESIREGSHDASAEHGGESYVTGTTVTGLPENAYWPTEGLELLKDRFIQLHSMSNDKARAPLFVQFLEDLLEFFDIRSQLKYQPDENHIEGTLRLDAVEHVIRAIWGDSSTHSLDISDVGPCAMDQEGKALGVLLSINGFQGESREVLTRPPSFVGIDGSDIFLVLDQRVRLDQLLRQKMNAAIEGAASSSALKT